MLENLSFQKPSYLKEGFGGGGGKEWNVPFEYKMENEGGFQTK